MKLNQADPSPRQAEHGASSATWPSPSSRPSRSSGVRRAPPTSPRRTDIAEPTGTTRPTDEPSPTVTVPDPRRLRGRCSVTPASGSSPGRTSSTASREHRPHESTSPSEPGGERLRWLEHRQHERRLFHVQPTRRRVVRRLPPDRRLSPGANDNPRRPGRGAQRTEGMGRGDRPVGHLHRRIQRQSVPTQVPRRLRRLHPWKHVPGQPVVSHFPKLGERGRRQQILVVLRAGHFETLYVFDLDGTIVILSMRASVGRTGGGAR